MGRFHVTSIKHTLDFEQLIRLFLPIYIRPALWFEDMMAIFLLLLLLFLLLLL